MLYTVVGVGFIALGLAIGWYGIRPLAIVPSVLRTTVRDPSEVTDVGSFVVCRGIANESGEALTSPFTGSRCLGFEFEAARCVAVGCFGDLDPEVLGEGNLVEDVGDSHCESGVGPQS